MLFFKTSNHKNPSYQACQILKILATCYSEVLLLIPYCSKVLLYFIIFFFFFHFLSCALYLFSLSLSLCPSMSLSLCLTTSRVCRSLWCSVWLGYGGFSWIVGLCSGKADDYTDSIPTGIFASLFASSSWIVG